MGVRYFKSGRGSALTAVARYAATLTAVVGATLWFGSVFWHGVIEAPVTVTTADVTTTPVTASAVLESGDDWTQNLRSEKFWASKKTGEPSKPYKTAKSETRGSSDPDFSGRSGLLKTTVPTPGAEPKAPSAPASKAPQSPLQSSKGSPKTERADGSTWYSGDGNHRTVCVRLCDGYFWPISFSTDRDNFGRDKRVCENSCGGSQTRLYTHENPGQDIEQMVDVKGVPYTKLRTAFLFRTSFDQSCKCNAHPWEQASKDRHRMYALEAEKRKGSQHAAAELTRMKSALIEARKAATAVRTAAIDTRTGGARIDAAPGAAPAITKRGDTPVSAVVARHAPLAGLLMGDETLGPLAAVLAAATAVPAVPTPRLPQWAQLVPPTAPPTGTPPTATTINDVTVGRPLIVASSDGVTKLPPAPFALPNTAPVMPLPTHSASLAIPSNRSGAPEPAPQAKAQASQRLAVTAPPIIAHASDELGIKAPMAVNTAQLEQINAARKTVETPVVKAKVAAAEPRNEPKVVERRAPPERKPEPRDERRVAVVRPASPPPLRVVERPTPRPAVRVVEASRPTPPIARARPQQVTAVRNDAWRVRVFEGRP
jgi:Protein of unknown function (DUF2865)